MRAVGGQSALKPSYGSLARELVSTPYSGRAVVKHRQSPASLMQTIRSPTSREAEGRGSHGLVGCGGRASLQTRRRCWAARRRYRRSRGDSSKRRPGVIRRTRRRRPGALDEVSAAVAGSSTCGSHREPRLLGNTGCTHRSDSTDDSARRPAVDANVAMPRPGRDSRPS